MSTADEIAALARQGNKIEAIKLLREVSGMGLKEAKEFLDREPTAQELGLVVKFAQKPAATGIGSAAVRRLVAEGQTIEAIKLLREETGLGLKEAKDAVDALRSPKPVEAPEASGGGLPVTWIVAALAAAATAGALWWAGIPLI